MVAFAAAAALASLVLGACGDKSGAPEMSAARAPCSSSPPGKAATYANANVAFARDAGIRESEEMQSTRIGGALPWFTKFGLYIRGDRDVVVRVPAVQQDVIEIRGWGSETRELRRDVLVRSTPGCRTSWTVYPGGLVFSGRHCVRLEVEGPGRQRGSARFGLRKDCST